MPTILITGAASGLGLAFLNHYISSASPSKIIAVDRHPIPVSDTRLQAYTLDLTSESSLQELSQNLKDTPIGLLVHSAGIRGLVPSAVAQHPGDAAKAETIEAMDIETISHTFQINAVATFTLIRTLLSNLRLAASGFSRPKVVIMSSRMGSVSYNNTGGGYAYRASKAALNAMVRSLSIDVPEVVFVLVHPGRVQTGLVPWKEDGAIQADESVKDMLGLIAKLSRDDSGRFMDRWGQDIGW